MRKEIITGLLLLAMLLVTMPTVNAQDIPSAGPAPKIDNPISPSVQYPVDGVMYYNSRAFGYNAYGTAVALGPLKFFLNSPTMTSLATDPQSTNFISGGSFASDGFWYGTRYGLNNLNKIDTVTGAITVVGSFTGSCTGLAFDWSTNTMYAMTYGTSSQLNTVNLSTGAMTPIGSTITGLIIDIACSNAGQLYGVDISLDNLVSINKTTGTATVIGPLGAAANYAQGMSWDHTVDSCYWASYTTLGEMRRINITTGASTLLYATNIELDGFAIPGAPGPQISHTALGNTENLTGPYVVNCVITPAGSPINPAMTRLFWSRNSTTITDSLLLTNTSGNNWTGNIPGNGTAATYRYYIKTVDNSNRVATAPGGAPANLYLFNAAPDVTKPVITHTALPSIPKANWPALVVATITDNIGIDSGWVKWYKYSAPGTIKQFKLINTSGSTFQALFNSDTSQVAAGDSIIYRIFAQDNSSNHNRDSSALFGFKLLNIVNACIGTGTVACGYPYYTFYMDSRTDMLYTAADILAGGGAAGSITKIGFNVTTAATQPMSGFKIKMQTTSSTSISTFTTTGWTTVFDGTYTVGGTGWQYVNLQTPYAWDGVGNLLIDICFNNSSYTSNTTLNGTAATGKVVHNHSDLASGDGCTDITSPGSGYTALPNLCLSIALPVGNQTIQTSVPKEFSLSQNYPNPFNPSTSIKFSLPKQNMVKLVVFDLLGREVATLVNDVKRAGNYEVTFDGTNIASGLYFYRIEAGDFTDVKKMILVK